MKLIRIIIINLKKFVNDCENEFGNTMFDKLCQNGNYELLTINETNKMNENGLLIALEDDLRVIELFNDYNMKKGGSRFNVNKCVKKNRY